MEKYFWMKHIWIEGKDAWFVSGFMNALFHLDLKTWTCSLLKKFPDCAFWNSIRNPVLIKCNELFFCFPDRGDRIWIYDIEKDMIDQINVENPMNKRIRIVSCWREGDIIYALSCGLKKILCINVKMRIIISMYSLSDINMDMDWYIINTTKVDNSIFILTNKDSIIYEFCLLTKKFYSHCIPIENTKVGTLVFDGEKYWLSGWKKEIYLWDKDTNEIDVIKGFPENFGQYNFREREQNIINYDVNIFNYPVFVRSICIDDFIWFFPFQTNLILCINRNTHKMRWISIEEEIESRESLSEYRPNDMKFYYLYDIGEQYIGLYSLQNKDILEIDTKNVEWEYKNLKLNKKNFVSEFKNEFLQKALYEGEETEIFKLLIQQCEEKKRVIEMSNIEDNTGTRIHDLV